MERWDKSNKTYLTIAISDLFLAICGCAAILHCIKKENIEVALGIGFVTFAAFLGVLRFGCSQETFGDWHKFFTKYAGKIGVPMIGFGFARMNGTFPEIMMLLHP